MLITTPEPPRLMNTDSPDPEHHGQLQDLLDGLVRDTATSYGVVFGTHGLHLLRSGNLGQVGVKAPGYTKDWYSELVSTGLIARPDTLPVFSPGTSDGQTESGVKR
ncbi:hypothetical protein ACFWTE_16735 [Nocardiopsis sp. NPDC058631]|uniref:hypothetical protein n=1 Tax=Nocardiopsis sp. NPDC058631 TaxID=3346566 RepID=UPI00365C2840